MDTKKVIGFCMKGVIAYGIYKLGMIAGMKKFSHNMCDGLKTSLTPDEYEEFDNLITIAGHRENLW